MTGPSLKRRSGRKPLSQVPIPVPDLPQKESPAQTAAQPVPARVSVHFKLKDPALWLLVWATGAFVSLSVPVGAYLRFSRALRKTLRVPEEAVLRQYATLPGKKPLIYVSQAVKTPLTLGLLRPKIILPSGLGEGETLANVLRHELTHVRWHDILYKWLALTVFSAHWFNPLTYVLRRELDQACELSCDEARLGAMTREEQHSYGDTLLQMAASRALPFGVVATTFATEKEKLKERLRQILTYQKSSARVLSAVLALVLLVACGVIAGPAAEAVRHADDQEPDPVEEPMSAWSSEEPEAALESAADEELVETPAASADEQYEAAAALFAAGDYEQAIAAFSALDGYKDSDEQIKACRAAILDEEYNAAFALYAGRSFAAAREAFATLGDYKDSYIRARAISAIQHPISAGY